jgi:hypothetical protein
MRQKFEYNQILAAISAFIRGSKLALIHKAGCHHAALAGCGGRVKCRWTKIEGCRSLFHRKERKVRKDVVTLTLRSLRTLRCSMS